MLSNALLKSVSSKAIYTAAIIGLTSVMVLTQTAAAEDVKESGQKPFLGYRSVKYVPYETEKVMIEAKPLPQKPFVVEKGHVREDTKIVINVPSRTLWVYHGTKIARYFPVGVGRRGFITPLGHFKVIRKVENPGWENPYMASGKVRVPPGDENPLGTRWIGFYENKMGEFGMHGTDRPSSVGKFSSHGCVRLKVSDAEVLFDLVDIGTPVDVVYEPVLIRKSGHDVRVLVYADLFQKGMPSLEKVKADIGKQYPGAAIDEETLADALAHPTERPVNVATLEKTQATNKP